MSFSNTFIFVPSNNIKFLNKSLNLNAKCIIYDLEDSVLPNDKENALNILTSFLSSNAKNIKSEIAIRFNFENYQKEIIYLTKNKINFDYAIIPKFNPLISLKEISTFWEINKIKQKIIFIVETTEGLNSILNTENTFNLNHVYGLMLGSNDLATDLGCSIDSEVIYKAKLELHLFCKFNNMEFIDSPDFNVTNYDALKTCCAYNKRNGINFKAAIHPNQIEIIDSFYKVDKSEYLKAKEIVNLYKEKGAFKLDDQMIDKANIKKALDIIEKYESDK